MKHIHHTYSVHHLVPGWLTGAILRLLLLVAIGSLAGCATSQALSGAVANLTISSQGEALAFDQNQLTVQTNQRVQLTFTNSSTILEHNWVLVGGGETLAAEVDRAGKLAGPASGYLLADVTRLIAHTWVLPPGATSSVSFVAPAPGRYIYLCTVPGHYDAGMKGEFVVQP